MYHVVGNREIGETYKSRRIRLTLDLEGLM